MRIAVVGLGQIGLPLAVQYASRGHEVIGCDVDAGVVAAVNDGQPPHPGEAEVDERLPGLVASGRLRATTDDRAGVDGAEAVVVIVPVAVDQERRIDFRAIDAATRDVGAGIGPGSLVVFETTLPVGTTRDRLTPVLAQESGLTPERDLFVAFSPERVLVGRVLTDLRRYPKVVGGIGPESARRATAFYDQVLDAGTEVRTVSSAEAAEMTKLAETTYRDVNIALANEYARFAAERDIDVIEVIEAANSQPYSHVHRPGVGVGGHCIPVYPYFLFTRCTRHAAAAGGPTRERRHGRLGGGGRRTCHGRPARRAGAGARHRLPWRCARGCLQQRLCVARRAAGRRRDGPRP